MQAAAPAAPAAQRVTQAAWRAAGRRVCRVYNASGGSGGGWSLRGPTLTHTLYVAQAMDVQNVTITISVKHEVIGALQVA